MFSEDLGSQRNRLFRRDGSVGPHLKDQLIIIRDLADPGVFHRIVRFDHRRVDRVNRNHTDYGRILLILLSRNIAAPFIENNLHIELGTLAQSGDVQFGVENFHLGISLDRTAGHFAGALRFDIDRLRLIAVHLGRQRFDIQNDFGDILRHAGHGRKLMHDAVDFDRGRCHARQGREQDPAQTVADGGSKTPLQRLQNEFAVGSVGKKVESFYSGLFNLNHLETSF